jgi:arylsulfatase A-like enzyme
MDPAVVTVPPFLPDTPEVRADILDYYYEVQRFDRSLEEILQKLDAVGLAADTIVVVTSDNGMPFPRCKANLYDSGTHMPLAIRWPKRIPGGMTIRGFVSLADLAPTFLGAAGLKVPADMTGRDLLPLTVSGPARAPARDAVFLERERHASVRAGNLSYPSRAIRTDDYLYLRNLRPNRWPAGDPVLVHSVGPFGDVDPSPTKELILDRKESPSFSAFYRLAFARRPGEELYDLKRDPFQLTNVAEDPAYATARDDLRSRLDRWLTATGDPLSPNYEPFDTYPYVGPPARPDLP